MRRTSREDCIVKWKNLRDGTGRVHKAVGPWSTKCGLRFMVDGRPRGAEVTDAEVTCQGCRMAIEEAA